MSSDVSTNQHRDEGRLVVIMMDRTIPAGPPTLKAQAIARAAVDALGPMDVAAVVHTTGIAKEGVSQGFTADKARLRAVIDAPFMGQTAPPSMGPRGLTYVKPDQEMTGDCPDGTCGLEAIRRLADAMAGVTGRQKTILFVGADIVMPSRLGDYALKEAYDKARARPRSRERDAARCRSHGTRDARRRLHADWQADGAVLAVRQPRSARVIWRCCPDIPAAARS